MSSIKKNTMQSLKTLILALVLIGGVNYAFAVDWTAPTSGPVGGNTSAPLNVTGLGQSKLGGLILNESRSSGQGLVVMSALTPYALTVNNSDGFVGVGVLQATESLDIFGKIKIRGGTPGVGKVLTSDAGGVGTWQTPASGGSAFWTDGTVANTITNSNTGNVGIGTAAPSTKLEVKGTGNQYIRLSSTASNVDIASQYSDTANNVSVFSGLLGASAGAGRWGVYNNGTRMVVDNSGNVGIGIVTPTTKLDVNGNTRIVGNVDVSGTARIGGGSPAVGKVLTSTDSSGNATWQTGVEVDAVNLGGGSTSGQICGVTSNKRFLVTVYGTVTVGGGGPPSVQATVNGVSATYPIYELAGNRQPFVIPVAVISTGGCINASVSVPGSGGAVMTSMSIVG